VVECKVIFTRRIGWQDKVIKSFFDKEKIMKEIKKGDVIEVTEEDPLRKGKSEYDYCGTGKRGVVLTGPDKNGVCYVCFIDNDGIERLVGCFQCQICKIDWTQELQKELGVKKITLETLATISNKMPWWQFEKVSELVYRLKKERKKGCEKNDC